MKLTVAHLSSTSRAETTFQFCIVDGDNSSPFHHDAAITTNEVTYTFFGQRNDHLGRIQEVA